MKKTLPVALGSLAGLFIILDYFVPREGVHDVTSHLLEWGSLVAAAAYVLGGIHLVQVTWPKIRKREADWQYKIVLLAGAGAMAIVGLPWRDLGGGTHEPGRVWKGGHEDASELVGEAIVVLEGSSDVQFRINAKVATATDSPRLQVPAGPITIHAGRRVVGYDSLDATIDAAAGDVIHVAADPQMRWGQNGRFRTWMYDHIFAPCSATMFALLAFFVASAAFRAFRARNVESTLLLGSAIIILLARAPIGRALSSKLPDVAQWILDVPSNGSRRAIIMGAAVAAIATGLRVILGLERSHLGDE